MSKKRCDRETSDQSERSPFAYPFKVLRDVFTDPPSVLDQEFARFEVKTPKVHVIHRADPG